MKAIALIESENHVSARYRLVPFAAALSRRGCSMVLHPVPRGFAGRLRLLKTLAAFDVVLLQRMLPRGFELSLMRRAARRLVFDFDDAVFHRDSFHRKGIDSTGHERRFARIACAADSLIAGNRHLADRAIAAGARRESVRVIPTCVEPSRYVPSVSGESRGLELVWIGSSSTLQGLEMRRELFAKLADHHAGLRLRVICDRFPGFDRPPIVPVRWSEAGEAGALAAAHVGISWMPDDEWSKGKCGLKVLQYFAAGLPVIANPVGVHSLMVIPGETGFLADSDEQWIDAVARMADAGERKRMGKSAREFVEAHYSVDRYQNCFANALLGTPETGNARGAAEV